ncbi:MAG: CpsB/CapC family capsule biosynthesis tyrosine phosphatase [Saprospiraceae bacterium]|nr:CpsB/CapC family capsule biosynthesis tyrosine phosphatase [Saprospiraceae bacterium]
MQWISRILSPSRPTDFSVLQTDLHSHLLPGIDDGVPDMNEALELIEALVEMGYRRLITTPHVSGERYPNTSAAIREAERATRDAIQKAGIPVEFRAAAEYMLDENFARLLKDNDLLPLDGQGRVLVEMSFLHPPLALNKYLFEMQGKGYTPVLAHPERYPFYHLKMEEYRALKGAGCLFQVNILSITGHYGPDVQQSALLLLRQGMADFLGTDAHRMRHAITLQAALRSGHLEKILTKYFFQNSAMN